MFIDIFSSLLMLIILLILKPNESESLGEIINDLFLNKTGFSENSLS